MRMPSDQAAVEVVHGERATSANRLAGGAIGRLSTEQHVIVFDRPDCGCHILRALAWHDSLAQTPGSARFSKAIAVRAALAPAAGPPATLSTQAARCIK